MNIFLNALLFPMNIIFLIVNIIVNELLFISLSGMLNLHSCTLGILIIEFVHPLIVIICHDHHDWYDHLNKFLPNG